MVWNSKAEVEWYLELINADLSKSFEDSTHELLDKMIRTFGSGIDHKELNEILAHFWGSEGQERDIARHDLLKIFIRLQKRLKTTLDEILDSYEKASQYEVEGNFFN